MAIRILMFKKTVKSFLFYVISLFARVKLKSENNYLIILMYHRVLPSDYPELDTVQPGMYVTPDTFNKHIEILRDYGEFVNLDEYLNDRRVNNKVPSRAISITFDDGWHDNYLNAYPILKKHGVSASIYLVSNMIDSNNLFWPERLSILIKTIIKNECYPALSETTKSWLNGIGYKQDISNIHNQDICIDDLIEGAKQQSDFEITEALNLLAKELEGCSNGVEKNNSRVILNWSEINEMLDSGIVQVGSHTCNHIRLNNNVEKNDIVNEIKSSLHEIQNKTRREVSSFCFPNGDYCKFSDEIVKKHYRSSVSTQRGINYFPCSPFLLKRISMHEDMSNTKQKLLCRVSGLL